MIAKLAFGTAEKLIQTYKVEFKKSFNQQNGQIGGDAQYQVTVDIAYIPGDADIDNLVKSALNIEQGKNDDFKIKIYPSAAKNAKSDKEIDMSTCQIINMEDIALSNTQRLIKVVIAPQTINHFNKDLNLKIS